MGNDEIGRRTRCRSLLSCRSSRVLCVQEQISGETFFSVVSQVTRNPRPLPCACAHSEVFLRNRPVIAKIPRRLIAFHPAFTDFARRLFPQTPVLRPASPGAR